ncbi:sensor histidine kinase [Pollutimonas thiosulfatoxidans]|uniref:histidine kinase n=1 Tax=Pollutimonas thiosulfatoxidans TaxID=2028345 RepID=A0A410G9J6_9BURK|nr:HAMP domain-containing sensor histidine kinase [Pollutimonas thiosulfatoxidans]MBF6616128.1 HAMP domain-containing histidine kinase [Candidimonas sp.]NYT45100.1 HAMP domain-containing histidine kinase [Alcaligenaceae bacterium]QAA92993.1 two-component sensor histidine kinase [Pollutimonas thiosulfatoxidans]
MPPGSLARRLVLRLFPAVVVLVLLDISATWVMTRKMSLEAWLLQDIFWTMVISQVALVSVFAWVLISGVRSGLASINRLSQEINQRSIEDLQPLDAGGLPSEVAPMVAHFNDLLLRLDDSMQAQRRFIGHAAHQLRTPLTGLKLELELMLTRNLPDDVRERAERIKLVTDRMIRLGQQLLVLARADSSTRPQDSFVRTDLCEWVRVSAAEWIPLARRKQIEVNLFAPETPVWVDVDSILLEELLSNLIDNALRYGTGATEINLKVGANPPSLSVEDNGPGIAQDDAARVFEAFYRSSRVGVEGSGLGLAIVREIARAHGAWWSLNSQPDFPGTRVTVVFPGPRIGAKLKRQE